MFFWKTEICLEVLIESSAAKTLKYFRDFCRVFDEDLQELGSLSRMSEQIMEKWKNFVLNTIFDEKKDNTSEFIKYKKHKRASL